jgi:superfamily I DNA/RNA helicase
LALKFRADYFRHILAVTFTNKATQEMKDRILEYLNAFAHGTNNELSEELRQSLQLDHATVPAIRTGSSGRHPCINTINSPSAP